VLASGSRDDHATTPSCGLCGSGRPADACSPNLRARGHPKPRKGEFADPAEHGDDTEATATVAAGRAVGEARADLTALIVRTIATQSPGAGNLRLLMAPGRDP
jgi:hypothetical protein